MPYNLLLQTLMQWTRQILGHNLRNYAEYHRATRPRQTTS